MRSAFSATREQSLDWFFPCLFSFQSEKNSFICYRMQDGAWLLGSLENANRYCHNHRLHTLTESK